MKTGTAIVIAAVLFTVAWIMTNRYEVVSPQGALFIYVVDNVIGDVRVCASGDGGECYEADQYDRDGYLED